MPLGHIWTQKFLALMFCCWKNNTKFHNRRTKKNAEFNDRTLGLQMYVCIRDRKSRQRMVAPIWWIIFWPIYVMWGMTEIHSSLPMWQIIAHVFKYCFSIQGYGQKVCVRITYCTREPTHSFGCGLFSQKVPTLFFNHH